MNTRRRIGRRTFLKGAGVALALPALEAMTPIYAAAEKTPDVPRRMIAVLTPLGLLPANFYPDKTGTDYTASPYLKILDDFRKDFTVVSGLSHPDCEGGHASEMCFLTGAPEPTRPSFRNTISIDQLAAERIGHLTRFPYLGVTTVSARDARLSWTRSGAHIPAEVSPSRVFAKLFLDGSTQQIREQVRHLKDGQSILDVVKAESKQLQRNVGPGDRQKLDDYFTSVRELEQRLVMNEDWAKKPKPKVTVPPPRDIASAGDIIGRLKLLFDLSHLALQTDSTRLITLYVSYTGIIPEVPGVTNDWHSLSHHSKRPEAIEQLGIFETAMFKALHGLLGKLKTTRENNDTLLDRTMVLFGSNMNDGTTHSNRNLPIVLAGGGFKHGQHLGFDAQRNRPLCNLYVSMLQRLGLEIGSFGSSTGTLTGLEKL